MDSDFVSADRLMRALSNGEFEPYLQPVFFASGLTVSGAELLVHRHMPAGEIIPVNKIESVGGFRPVSGETCKWKTEDSFPL